MLHWLITLTLLPVLIVQGKYVRKRTPKLPEPVGARLIKADEEKAFNILVLGDSAAAGVGVAKQDQALLGQVAKALGNKKFSYTLMAKTGATTKDTYQMISTLADEKYHAVVTSLGVNDVTKGISREAFRQQQLALINTIKDKFDPELIVVTHIPPMHQFPALPQPLRWYLGRRAKQLNHDLANICKPLKNVNTLIIALPSNPELMAKDGFHPGHQVYQQWAQSAATLINKGQS